MRPRPIILLVAALQLTVPAAMLVDRWRDEGMRPVSERPASFQMYSAVRSPTYVGTDAGGRSRVLDVEPLPPVVRAASTSQEVLERLCALHPDLVAVRRDGGQQPGERPC